MTRIDVNGYLNRLGVREVPEPSLATLRRLQTAHVERIPHENLEIQLSREISIDPEESVARILRGRGGCCHHLNGAFATLLERLGYVVTWHRGGVHAVSSAPPPGADGSHLAITVEAEEQTWYVDVGLGDALYEPLPLRPGEYHQGPFTYRLRPSDVEENGWRFDHDPQGAFVGMDFDLSPASLGEFVAKDVELKTALGSRFVQLVAVTRRDRDGADELLDCVLSRVDVRGRTEMEVATRDEWFAVLADTFGLHLDDVEDVDRGKLWDKVSSRHRASQERQRKRGSRASPGCPDQPDTDGQVRADPPAGPTELVTGSSDTAAVIQNAVDGAEPANDPAPPWRVLDETGRLVGEGPSLDVLLDGYRRLLLCRRLNEQAGALVRQGRLAVYASSRGQEACQVACVTALAEQDWLFPTYRDSAAVVARGVDPVAVLSTQRGDWHCGYDPVAHRVAPQANPLATQLLHAVGVAHAARLKGEPTVAMALCGDGATSEGDFHEACNFAAVFNAPVVFLIQNNKYAISVPLARQTAASSLAAKAVGYGMPGVRVDGNDLAAVHDVLSSAVTRARAGHGPTLVEADTYRLDAHTNADDASRYRSDAEVERWAARDPLIRLRAYLVAAQTLDETLEKALRVEAEEMADHLRAGLSSEAAVNPDDLFAYVYSSPTPQLVEQRAALRAELALEDELR